MSLATKSWTPPPKNPKFDVSKRLYMIRSSDPDGRGYGRSLDPKTGRYYGCTGAKHHGCANSGERASKMYTFQYHLEDAPEMYPFLALDPNCIECGEPLVQGSSGQKE